MALLDGEKQSLEIKNGHTYAEWTDVYITSNMRYPEEVYPGAHPETRKALFRRVTHVRETTQHWREQTPIVWENEEMSEEPIAIIEDELSEDGSGKPPLIRQHGFIFDD